MYNILRLSRDSLFSMESAAAKTPNALEFLNKQINAIFSNHWFTVLQQNFTQNPLWEKKAALLFTVHPLNPDTFKIT